MGGLIHRSSTILKRRISRLLDHGEDPVEPLDQAYDRQLEQLKNVRNNICDVIAAQRRLLTKESMPAQDADEFDDRTRGGMTYRREALAPSGLECGYQVGADAPTLEQQISELEGAKERLTNAEEQLRARVDAFRADKHAANAKRWLTEKQAYLAQATADVGDALADMTLAIQRAIEITERMRERATASEKP